MIDVSGKPETHRVAIARGRVQTTAEVIGLVRADGLPKADVLATARIAGIAGAKRTSDLIPLCHPLPLTGVTVIFELGETTIDIEAIAKTTGRTGVEMEALTAVAVAGLTLHDMIKAVDPGSTITDIRLDFKSGGKRGRWERGRTEPVRTADEEARPAAQDEAQARPASLTARVIVASTRGAAGEREDTTGPVIVAWLAERGYQTGPAMVVADADVAGALADAVGEHPSVVVTTGGTGVSPTDVTPEATRAVLDRELPGVAEALRARGLASTPAAALSRGLAGTSGRTVVVNLPGSRGGVADGLEVLDGILAHLVDQVSGSARHDESVETREHDRG
ncbi:bifunctional molybdenum cofactor biosynthesis protein MoaC/MoaB [Diaminobutyricibacter tongyongensis]|uniref:cyclic pyranopterin monophosphate synthase n=2 Tax=Leifsonia tongyongensis TaxID=1268043 RepID=A0A6L9Y1D0_9MICO|nr:bifunctional molybdenum cofactor biosynthesis protein MoaC/MoaB [Diaminobutyricibacter tongyongensis]NEN07480.1 bifunctional molybdenum cofactor biosynthesis protein MoaC/MoaB [Diaminobutyricibacter tongyongensis]